MAILILAKTTGTGSVTPWDLSGGATKEAELDVSAQGGFPSAMAFKPDGLTMFVVNQTNRNISQYTLSSAWDISTATYASKLFGVGSQDQVPEGLALKDDGTKFWIAGRNNDNIYQYSMSVAYDISTASYDSISVSLSGTESDLSGITWRPNGDEFFILGYNTDTARKYPTSTNWNLNGMGAQANSYTFGFESATPQGIRFSTDGTKMFMTGSDQDRVYEYTLSTPWDLSTASYGSVFVDVTVSGRTFSIKSYDVEFKPDGTKFYVVDWENGFIDQYAL